ncbi:MAG: hypothetical protein JWR77_816 [Rhizorhabdus sp.]|nr:hypothetical protein [Rhizorhabdus sp.]
MSKPVPESEFSQGISTTEKMLGGFDPAFAQFIEMVAGELSDNLDHPEVWSVLEDLARQGSGPDMVEQIAHLRPHQNPFITKVMDIMSGIMTAVIDSPIKGLAQLKQLESMYRLCPQIAGACFFVTHFDAPEMRDLSNKFCEFPFNRFDTLIDGTVAPCCSIWTQKRLGRLDSQSFQEIWNGRDAQEMRESILDGSFRYCDKQRCIHITQNLLPNREDVTDPDLRAIIDAGKTKIDIQPRNLALAHDTTCNLACPSCRNGMLTATDEQEVRFDTILHQVFHPLLQSGRDINLFLSGQGDPWSSQHYRSILRYAADHDLPLETLVINTNALLMGPKRWSEYAGLEKYRPSVRVSVDACTPWVYEEVRRPGKFDRLYENLRFISEKYRAGIFSFFNINATVQLDNYHEIPALIDFAEQLHCVDVLFYMIQNTGEHLDASYDRMNIGDSSHPLYRAFLETLRDPKLDRPIVNMFDVAIMRHLAVATHLPSDDLGQDFSRDDLGRAIDAAFEADDLQRVVALCVAGRIRFPDDRKLLRIEAAALTGMGFPKQAIYRMRMADAMDEADIETEDGLSRRVIDRLMV